MSARLPSTRCSMVTRPTRMWANSGNAVGASLVAPRFERRHRVEEGADFLARDAPVDGNALDAALLQPVDQRSDGIRLGHRHVVDDDFVADDADDHRRIEAVQQLDGGGKRLDVARDDRMARRIELPGSERRREAAEQLVGELQPRCGHERASPLARPASARSSSAGARRCEHRATRSMRLRRVPACASAVPIRASASAAADRRAVLRRGAHHSPR